MDVPGDSVCGVSDENGFQLDRCKKIGACAGNDSEGSTTVRNPLWIGSIVVELYPVAPVVSQLGEKMLRKHRARAVLPLFFCIIALANAMRIPGFDDIRAVQFLSIFAAGMCGGVSLALLISDLRSRSESEIEKK